MSPISNDSPALKPRSHAKLRVASSTVLFTLVFAIAFLPAPATAQTTDSAGYVAATGDGIADDTAAIQAAVDAKTGGLRFRRGTYRLTETVVIDLERVGFTSISGDGVTTFVMEGSGPAFRFVGTHAGTAAPKTVKPNVWINQRTPCVDAIEIVGKSKNADGIEATGTMQLTLTRLTIRDTRHAIHLVGRNRNVTLSECHLYHNSGVGVFLDRLNLHQINIANCHISYNAGGGVVARESEIRNLQIGTCDIEGNMPQSDSNAVNQRAPLPNVLAPATANIDLDATNSSLGEVAIVGCTIQHAHDTPGSANIRINGQSTPRAFTDETRHGNITISDNVMSDTCVNVDLKNVRGATFSGNTIWKGYDHNVVLRNCSNVAMTGNVFDRNPRYHYGDGSTAKLGVLIEGCADCTLTGNHHSGVVLAEAALVIRDSTRINMMGCTILDYGVCGLLLDGVTRSQISGCLIRDDRQADDVKRGFAIIQRRLSETRVQNNSLGSR